MTRLILMASLLLPVASLAQAGQAPTAQVAAPAIFELRLHDGSVAYGFVEAEDTDHVVFRTIAGVRIDVKRSDIASMKAARGQVVDGKFRPSDSNATRLLFGPTGRALRKGEGYVGVYEFLLPFVQVGVTDRFSIGAGSPLIFVGDGADHPVWVTPKYQFYRGARTSAAAGVMHFFAFGASERVGIAYAVETTGTDDSAFSAGLGWAYARYTETDRSCTPSGAPGAPPSLVCGETGRRTETHGSAVLMLGGEHRVSRRIKVVTENYAFEAGGIVMVGVRFLGDRLSADLGLVSPITGDGFFAGPVVNFVWTFGK